MFIRRWINHLGSLPRTALEVLFAYDIFISYAHKDGISYAKALDEELSRTFTTHLDSRDFLAGQDLSLLTKLRVRRSRLLLVVARPASLNQSFWVRQEVEVYTATDRRPILVDVDGAIDQSIVAPKKDRLSDWLAQDMFVEHDGTRIDTFLRIVDGLPDTGPDRLPSPNVAEAVAGRFTGDRVETRRLRVITATLVLLIAISLGAVLAANMAIVSARQSQAEALANEALVASTGTLLAVGNLTDALERVTHALVLAPTSNVLGAASRIESLVPNGLVYPRESFGEIRAMTASHDRVIALEGKRIISLEPETLIATETWSLEELGGSGYSSLTAIPGGFVAVNAHTSVAVRTSRPENFTVSGRLVVARPGGGFAAVDAITNSLSLFDDDERSVPFPCPIPNINPAWASFLDDQRFLIAGRAGAENRLLVLNLVDCTNLSALLPAQPMEGIVLPETKHIVLRSPQSAMVFSFDLSGSQLFPITNTSAMVAVSGPAQGFAVGTSDGGIEVFSVSPERATTRAGAINKLLPGTVTAMAHDQTTNRIVAAGRIGFFVGSGRGTFASLPLEVSASGDLRIVGSRPVQTIERFTSADRPTAFFSSPTAVMFAQRDSKVTWLREDGSVSFSLSGLAGNFEGGPRAISAYGDTLYAAWWDDDTGIVVGVTPLGKEVFRHPTKWPIRKLAAGPNGVLVVPGVPAGFFDFTSDPVVSVISSNDDDILFAVPFLNMNSGHGSVGVDPTGRSVAFARFDGVEFRPYEALTEAGNCLVKPDPDDPKAAAVAMAFAPDGNSVVLGTWDGVLSIWRRAETCWQMVTRLESIAGRMIPSLAFDGTIVLGRSLANPPMLRRWDAATGKEIGAGYQVDVRAIRVHPEATQQSDWPWNRFWGDDSGGPVIDFVNLEGIGQLDLTTDALMKRLCHTLEPAVASQLTSTTHSSHPCN